MRRAGVLAVLCLAAPLASAQHILPVSPGPATQWSGTLPPALQFPTGRSVVQFPHPVWGAARLDWCHGPGRSFCGPPAADAFCRAQGFNRVVSMVEEPNAGLLGPTHQIGSATLCVGPRCSGFVSITCSRT